MILKYIERMIKEQSSTTHESAGSSSKTKPTILEMAEESKISKKEEDEKMNDRSKFKKVEMSVFNGEV